VQCVEVCGSVLQVGWPGYHLGAPWADCRHHVGRVMLQCAAGCCNVLQRVAMLRGAVVNVQIYFTKGKV